MTPEDAHTFEIAAPTKFCIIDFTESFFSKSANRQEEKMDVSEFFKRLEYIFHNHHNVRGNLIADEDRNTFEVLINQLIMEKEHEQSFGKIITQNIVFLLLTLLPETSNGILSFTPKKKTQRIKFMILLLTFSKIFMTRN